MTSSKTHIDQGLNFVVWGSVHRNKWLAGWLAAASHPSYKDIFTCNVKFIFIQRDCIIHWKPKWYDTIYWIQWIKGFISLQCRTVQLHFKRNGEILTVNAYNPSWIMIMKSIWHRWILTSHGDCANRKTFVVSECNLYKMVTK